MSERRPRATRKTRTAKTAPASVPPSLAAKRMKLELEIHREELATQNEDLRRANASLASAKERYALLYDRAPVGYFTLDVEGTLVEANTAGAALVGVSRQFLFGRSFDELVATSSRSAFRRFRERVLDNNLPASHENVLVTGRGLLPVRIEAAPLFGDHLGGGECILCVTDESERRELEAQRRRNQAMLAESDRLASLGRLAAGVAHDFNNILSVVLVRAELLLLEEALPESAAEHMREIRSATTRAAALSQQMLTYAGRSPIRFALLDLSRVVRASAPALERLTPEHSLHLELADDLPAVEGDAAQIAQLLTNLVTNAAEALGPRGNIVVRTRHEAGDVVLEVVDDGRGMDESTRLHAFDPFFTTKFAGRGLGLAVVHGHALAHRARVAIESRQQHGATLRITFPAADLLVTSANDVNGVSGDDAPVRGLILVVDDEDAVRAATGRLLERMGFHVCSARDGLEGLSLLRAPPAEIVAVVLDLTMPRLDGKKMLQRLREDSNVPVLLMSGYAQEQIANDVLALADGFVAKPFTATALRRALTGALRSNRNREVR